MMCIFFKYMNTSVVGTVYYKSVYYKSLYYKSKTSCKMMPTDTVVHCIRERTYSLTTLIKNAGRG